MTDTTSGYCSQCGASAKPGALRCLRCGEWTQSPILPIVLMLLFAASLILAYYVANYYVPGFLAQLRYLDRIFAARPAFPGVGILVAFDSLYVRYLFWIALALTFGGMGYSLWAARKKPPRAAPGWKTGLLVLLLGSAGLAAVGLQFVVVRTYFIVIPKVITLLPDHLAFRAMRLEAKGRIPEAGRLLRRAVETIPPYEEGRKQEMARLYEAFRARHPVKQGSNKAPKPAKTNDSSVDK